MQWRAPRIHLWSREAMKRFGGTNPPERKLIVQLLFAAEDSSLPLDGSWSPALRGAKVREAGRTQNMEAQLEHSLQGKDKQTGKHVLPSVPFGKWGRRHTINKCSCRDQARSMTIPSVARRRQSLVFSNRRCASGCKASDHSSALLDP